MDPRLICFYSPQRRKIRGVCCLFELTREVKTFLTIPHIWSHRTYNTEVMLAGTARRTAPEVRKTVGKGRPGQQMCEQLLPRQAIRSLDPPQGSSKQRPMHAKNGIVGLATEVGTEVHSRQAQLPIRVCMDLMAVRRVHHCRDCKKILCGTASGHPWMMAWMARMG